jgi:hypothetical protein
MCFWQYCTASLLSACVPDSDACLPAAVLAACSIYTHQSGWTIPDHQLRSAVKRVIKDDLLDTYQDFLRR